MKKSSCILITVLCLAVVAGELSLSMRLESGMALERGCNALREWQTSDGSWGGSVQCTADAVIAFAMMGSEFNSEYAAAQGRGTAWLAARLAGTRSCPELASGGCALLRSEHPDAATCASRLLSLAPQWHPGPEQFPDVLRAFDLLYLTGNAQSAAGAAVFKRLSDVIRGGSDNKALLSAVDVMSGRAANLPELTELGGDYCGLLWAVRARRESSGRWRDKVVSLLFDGQRPDGGWGNVGESVLERASATALAVQIMVHCLSGGK